MKYFCFLGNISIKYPITLDIHMYIVEGNAQELMGQGGI